MAIVEAYEATPEVIQPTNEYLDLHGLHFLQEDILNIAYLLSRPEGVTLLRPIEERCLEEKLSEYKQDIEDSSLLVINTPRRVTEQGDAYKLLIDEFADDKDDETRAFYIPREAIQAVDVLAGQRSEHDFHPTVWMKVKTGQEKPITSFKNSWLVEDHSQGRWYNFPLEHSRVTALTKTNQNL